MRQLKTTNGHLMPCSSICIMNLPTLLTILSLRASPCWQLGIGMDLSTLTAC